MKDFILRGWKESDAQAFARAADNPKIAGNLRNAFPNPYTLADAKQFISDCISNQDENQIVKAIAVDGKAAGCISVFIQSDVYERSGELGYWLSEEYWRQGITSRAVRMICKEAFDTFDIVRIYAEPFDCNEGSKRVLEKAGFSYEGTMRNGVYKNGMIHSYCMYSILREEMDG